MMSKYVCDNNMRRLLLKSGHVHVMPFRNDETYKLIYMYESESESEPALFGKI